MQSYMDDNRSWMPMMLYCGLMDMVMFTSMMAFMGLNMNRLKVFRVIHRHLNQMGLEGRRFKAAASDTGDYSNMDVGGMDTGGFDSF